jgi:hypothetical protein
MAGSSLCLKAPARAVLISNELYEENSYPCEKFQSNLGVNLVRF